MKSNKTEHLPDGQSVEREHTSVDGPAPRRMRHHVGRAAVPRAVGQAPVGIAVGQAAPLDRAATSVLKIGSELPPPVFVDPSGTRRRRLRRITYALGALVLIVLVALWLSQLGGPVGPDPDAPCPSAAAGTGEANCR
jgi:hypothetical protein